MKHWLLVATLACGCSRALPRSHDVADGGIILAVDAAAGITLCDMSAADLASVSVPDLAVECSPSCAAGYDCIAGTCREIACGPCFEIDGGLLCPCSCSVCRVGLTCYNGDGGTLVTVEKCL